LGKDNWKGYRWKVGYYNTKKLPSTNETT